MLELESPPQFYIETQPDCETSQDRFQARIATNFPSSCIDLPSRTPLLPWANARERHISQDPRIVANHGKQNAPNDFLFLNQESAVHADNVCPLMDPLLKDTSFYCESECSDCNVSTSKYDIDNILELNGFRCVCYFIIIRTAI
jgi:hypothetical protein